MRECLRHRVARDAAEHRRIGDAVAAQPIRAVDAARILAGNEQSVAFRRAVGRKLDAAHHVMRGRHDFDLARGEIETAIGATLDHALELAAHVLGTEMRHAEPDAAVGRRAPGAHLAEDCARHDVARRALPARIVTVHEAIAVAVQQITARAAQSFLEHRAGHSRVRAGEQARGMELHHLHVAQRQAARSAIARPSQLLSPDGVWNRYIVGPPPVARSDRLRLHEERLAGANVDHQHAGERTVARRDEVDCAMLLEAPYPARPHLLGETAHDLDAGQVALVHGAVERLSGERLLVDGAVGIAIEKASELVFELVNALDRAADERPREILVRQPLAAFDRVHEMALDRIAGCQRDVVAALHHPRAAAFAEQALDGDRDVERRIALVRVQRGEQSRPAGAENQDVGPQPRKFHHALTFSAASAAARRSRAA